MGYIESVSHDPIRGLAEECSGLSYLPEAGHFFAEFSKYLVDPKNIADVSVLEPALEAAFQLMPVGGIDRIRVLKGLAVATVAHQQNKILKSHYRKERDHLGRKIPYARHVITVGNRLLADGFDPRIVVAGYCHDVDEDCDYTNNEVSVTRQQWADPLRRLFSDQEDMSFGAEVVGRIAGVTESGYRINPDINLPETVLYKIIYSTLNLGNLRKKIIHDDSDTAIKAKMVAEGVISSQVKAMKAEIEFPGTLAVKLTDIWENTRSVNFVKPEKILRAVIAASIADYMGWSISRDIYLQIAGVCNLNNSYKPWNGEQTELNDALLQEFRDPLVRGILLSQGNLFERYQIGFLRPTTDIARIESARSLPAPVSYYNWGRGALLDISQVTAEVHGVDAVLLKNYDSNNHFSAQVVRDGTNNATRVGFWRFGGDIERMRRWFGRDMVTYMAYHSLKSMVGFRLYDTQPKYIDDLSNLNVAFQSPERFLFQEPYGNLSAVDVERQLLSRLGYLYAPGALANVGAQEYVALYRKEKESDLECGINFLPYDMDIRDVVDRMPFLSSELYPLCKVGNREVALYDRLKGTVAGSRRPRSRVLKELMGRDAGRGMKSRTLFISNNRERVLQHSW